MQELNPFINSKIKRRIVYYQNPSFEDLGRFDAFIVGSDQTWRPKYVEDVEYYFLNFIPVEKNVLRIAYAPSFGTDKWEYSPEQTQVCSELLKRFDAVSVREESAVKLCLEHLGVKPFHVLDPTMLLTKEDYLNVVGKKYANEKKLSYYLLDYADEKMQIINKVCEKLQLTPFRVNTETENHKARLEDRIAPSIEKWIGGFAESSFIVADSFHATVFAILFNKPFITIANPKRGLARFESLLNIFGLKDRIVSSLSQLDGQLFNSSIDWNNVNELLTIQRKKSVDFLNSSLNLFCQNRLQETDNQLINNG